MLSSATERLKTLLILWSFPSLRKSLHHALAEGLVTLLDYKRLGMLVAALRSTSKIEGEIIEFGTFKGGSAAVLLQESKDEKYLHLFDSFQGMPDVNIQDNFHKKGDFADTQATQVQRGLEKFGNNFELHVGFFADTIPEIEASRPGIQFSLVHIDADLYESILDALKYCYPRMASGAIIVFDDYGSPTCLGAKKAVDEFFENKPETVMQLSGPQYGCVIGGGNIIKKLGENMSFLSRGGSLGRWIFDRSE